MSEQKPHVNVNTLNKQLKDLTQLVKSQQDTIGKLQQESKSKDDLITKKLGKDKELLPESLIGTSGEINLWNDKVVCKLYMGKIYKDGKPEMLNQIKYDPIKKVNYVAREDIQLTYDDGETEIVNYQDFMNMRSTRPCQIIGKEGDPELKGSKVQRDDRDEIIYKQNDNFHYLVEFEGKEYKIHHSAFN
jgi:hypothetical protein